MFQLASELHQLCFSIYFPFLIRFSFFSKNNLWAMPYVSRCTESATTILAQGKLWFRVSHAVRNSEQQYRLLLKAAEAAVVACLQVEVIRETWLSFAQRSFEVH
jgi:hypothetical protein